MLRGVSDEFIGGDLMLKGKDRKQVSLRPWRKCFSYVTQDPLVWEATVRDLLLVQDFGPDAKTSPEDDRLWQILDSVNLGETFRKRSEGLSTIVVPPGKTSAKKDAMVLTVSQTHLLAFARTLLESDRHFLLMDELSSNLDDEAEQLTVNLILRSPILQERTVIAVSHRIGFIIAFDYIILMDDGIILEEGRPEELLANPASRFKRLCDLQGGATRLRRSNTMVVVPGGGIETEQGEKVSQDEEIGG